MNRIGCSFFLAVFCLSTLCRAENKENTLKDVLRNNTKSRVKNQSDNDANRYDEDDNVLKMEAQKMLKQCGVQKIDHGTDFSKNNNRWKGNSDYDSGYFGNNQRQNGKNRNYNGGYEQDGYNNNDSDGSWNSYGSDNNWQSNQHRYNNNNNNNNKFDNNGPNDNNNNYYQSGRRNPDNSYGNRFGTGYNQNNKNNNNNDEMYGSNNNDQGYGLWYPNGGYQGSGSNNNAFDVRRPFGGGFRADDCNRRDFRKSSFASNAGMLFGIRNSPRRNERSNYFNREDNDSRENNQCVSQCVFGYLSLLDDDRSPSETMVIKWLQDHVNGNDMDRIKALRDARRCFARITTTDIEDGCEFSTELSKCLELDLE